MDLSTIDPELIRSRGEYATCNGEYKDLMKKIQELSQAACDEVRTGLRDINKYKFLNAKCVCEELTKLAEKANELKTQKDDLYKAAWGK